MPINLYQFTLQDFVIHLSDIKRYNGVGISVLEHSYYLGLALQNLSFDKDLYSELCKDMELIKVYFNSQIFNKD
jgi:hypothetical protein